MTKRRWQVPALGALLLATGCAMLGRPSELVELRRVAEVDIAGERFRALFLAGVEQAEWSLDRGDPATAGNILNGLSYLAYEVRDEISAEGAMATILIVHDLRKRGIAAGTVPGWIVPISRPDTDCNLTSGRCDIPDTTRICYELYSMPDTLAIGCIAVDKR